MLFSLTAVWLGFPLLDPIGGGLIAVLIAYTGYQIARETSRILSDRVVIDEGDLHGVVMSVPGCSAATTSGSRGSSDHAFIDLHVWLPAAMPLNQRARAVTRREGSADGEYPQIADAVIHIEPPPEER